MSATTVVAEFKIDGVLASATSVKLSDATGTYGVKRTDTDAVVVADDTAMTEVSTGVYSYTFTDPAAGLTYAYVVEAVYNGITTRESGTILGGNDSLGALYDLLPYVIPYAPGAPYEVIRQALRLACQEFCERSNIWREDLALVTEEDEPHYTLTHSYQAVVHAVHSIIRTTEETDWGHYTVSDDRTTVTLDPIPTEDDIDLTAKIVYVPLRTLTSLPAHILQRWGHYFAQGALMHLYEMPLKPWTSPREAMNARANFHEGLAKAKHQRITQGKSGNVIARPGFFC